MFVSSKQYYLVLWYCLHLYCSFFNRDNAPFLLTAAQITALLDSNPKIQPVFSFSSCVVLSSSLGLGFHRKPIVFCVKQSLLSHAATLRCR